MTKSRVARAVALWGVILVASAVAAAADKPQTKPPFDYRQTTLDNGLKVLTLEDFSCPIVCVEVWYHVGSKNERPDRQGFAHMFEHMMFRGTDRLGPTDHFDLMRSVGGKPGGSTGFDRTVYVETLPASQLEMALWLEAERMAFLKVDQQSFDTERKVVEEERRMGLNRPYGSLFEKSMAELYKAHPYRWTPIGRIDHLRAAAVQELRDFWQLYYAPNNATLIIGGAVRHADAQAMAKRYFGWIPRGKDVPKVEVREPMPTQARSVTIRQTSAPAPVVAVAFRSAAMKDPDRIPLDMLIRILGVGNSSRAYRELVADRQLAVQIDAYNYSMEQEGVCYLGAGLPPLGADPQAAMAAIEKLIAGMRDEKVTDHELTKARNQMLRRHVTRTLHVTDRAGVLAEAAVLMGDTSFVERNLEQMRKVTADDIQRVARKWLAPGRALKIIVPQNVTGALAERIKGLLGRDEKREEDAPITAKPEKAAPPPGRPGAKRPDGYPASPPTARLSTERIDVPHSRHKLDNGLKVIVIPNHEAPFVSVKLGLLAGAWSETRPGTCSLAMRMLTKGTAGRSERRIAEEAETYAISLGGAGTHDYSEVNASCLSEHLDRAMELLADVALKATFAPDEFAKLQRRTVAGLKIRAAGPGYVADRMLDRLVFGSHPYGRPAGGEPNDVAALKVEDLKQWWARFARPDMAVLILAGDVTDKHALELAAKAFGGWKADGPTPEVRIPDPPAPAPIRIYLVDRPGTIQTEIRMGHLGYARGDERYFTGTVMDGYFGRGFGSRLNRALRVDNGLTYGIVGLHQTWARSGRFFVGTFTKTDSAAEAVKAILSEIEDSLLEVKPTDKELNDTKSYILGSFPGRRETPMQLASDLWLIEREGLGEGWFEKLLTKVSAVTADECLKLARQTVHPSKLTIVVVGDAARLEDSLAKIAPVTVLERAEAPATPPADEVRAKTDTGRN